MAETELVNGGRFVHWNESGPYGYWGVSQSRTPNRDYTVAGVAGGTATTAEQPDSGAESRVKTDAAPLKSGGAK